MNERLELLPLLRNLVLTAMLLSGALARAQDFADVEVRTVPLRGSVYALFGAGGNIAVSVGPDGILMVDDQYAPLADRIRAAIGKLRRGEVDYVINTHWHGDHVGGNEIFGGRGAMILAHENVWRRMSTEQTMTVFDRTVPAAPEVALPVITHDDGMTLRFNGHTIRVHATAPSHTDGDSLVHFVEANIVHMGDTFVTNGLPFLDLGSGGSIDGLIDTIRKGIAITDATSIVVPGHGPISDRNGLIGYHEMLVTIRARIAAGIERGLGLEAILATEPLRGYEAVAAGGFMKGPQAAGFIYQSLLQAQAAGN